MLNNYPFDTYLKPRLLSPWRLRNDINYLVVYYCANGEAKHYVLSPYESSIMPFFNGCYRIDQIYSFWKEIHKSSTTITTETLTDIITNWIKIGFIGFSGEISPSVKYDPKHFIPTFKAYKHTNYRLARPLGIEITPTNRCKTNCIYCYAEKNECTELSLDIWNSIFDEISSNEIYVVDIMGGDFFARPDALELLESMVKRDYVFFLSTKCYISEKMAEKLSELGIGINSALPHLVRPMQFSIDSTDPKKAAFLCGPVDFLERAEASVRNMLKTGMTPRIKSVITAYNADSPEGVVKLFSDMGVTEFQFVQYGRSYYRHDDSLFLSKNQKVRFIESISKLRQDYPNLSITAQEDASELPPQNMTIERWHSRAFCSGGRISMKIQPNGDVTLCEQLPHTRDFVVGNVLQQGVIGVWNSEKMIKFLNKPKESFYGTVCFDCKEFEQCHYHLGYCFRDSLFNYGTIFEAPPACPHQSKVGLRET